MVDLADFRFEELRAETSMSNQNTAIYNVPRRGYLSGILVRFGAATVSGATNARNYAKIIDNITDIKLVANGGYDVIDVHGWTIQACSFYDNGVSPFGKYREYSVNTQFDTIFIPLGAKPFDPSAMLPLKNLDSLQLQITNDLSTSYWGTPAATVLGVIADKPVGGVNVEGFYRKQEWRKYTTASDGWKYFELPTTHRLRRVILHAEPPVSSEAYTQDYYNMLYNIEYKLHSGATTVFDKNLLYLVHMNAFEYFGAAMTSMHPYRPADTKYNCQLGERVGQAGIWSSKSGSGATNPLTIAEGDDAHVNFEVYEGDMQQSVMFRGLGLHFTGVLRHDRVGLNNKLPHMNDIKTVMLNLHTRSGASYADGTVRVVLDRFVPLSEFEFK